MGDPAPVVETRLPLAGYRVLELAHLIAGPVGGLYLADMGADVVKIESPHGGDATRRVYGARYGSEAAVFVTVNRNKRSVAIDLAKPEGRAAFLRLAATADVMLEAYKGGVAERLGIDYQNVLTVNPRIIYCSLSAFGPTGPWKDKPGVDMLVQAMGGMMAITGEPDGGPVLCSVPVIDTMGALMAGAAIVTALLHRERTGEGQRVDVSLLNGLMLAQAARLAVFWVTGKEPARLGSGHPHLAPFQAFMAKDTWIYVAVWRDGLWEPFCAAIDRTDLAGDPRFVTRDDRITNRVALTAVLEPIFRERTMGEWMAALEAHDVLCAPVNRYADLESDPQISASDTLVEEHHPRAGRFRTINTPIRFERTPGTRRTGAPALGEHTDAILREAGISSDELTRLRAAMIVA
ncbi:MAG: CaiB/BaiF CoA transferase family protein [Candidatus Rokuibacteriota bacterium]